MSTEKKDTSPIFGRARRIKRRIRIEERNDPPMPNTFDVTVEYASDELPEWFAPLQAIVEDETFTSMVITLGPHRLGGGKTEYYISLAEQSDKPEQSKAPHNREIDLGPHSFESPNYGCFDEDL